MERNDLNDLQRIADSINIPSTDSKRKPIIKVIGVGGGGNNAINHMYNQGVNDVTFVVCNTDKQALDNSPVPTKVQIGDGLGAGADPEKGRQAAEDDTEKIAALFDDDTKMVFITAGMGGGTGTGAGPVVARIAREKGLLTVGIVTIPFLFEGKRKILKALDGADEMAKYVDALLIINNERITEIYADYDFINAFNKADDTLSTAARSISEIITSDGYINLDFNDVNTTLRDGGTAIISCGYGEGEGRVGQAIDDALNSPLLRNRDIFGSKHLLFNLYFSREASTPFKMAEVQEITNFVNNIDPTVDVIWGVGFDDSLGDKVKMTILAAGFDTDIRKDEAQTMQEGMHIPGRPAQRQPPHTPQQNIRPAEERRPSAPTPYQPQAPRHQPVQEFAPVTPKSAPKPNLDDERRIENEYGAEQLTALKSNVDRSKYVVLSPSQLDDPELIDRLEHSPAYNRDKRTSEEIKGIGVHTPAEPARANEQQNPQGGNAISFY